MELQLWVMARTTFKITLCVWVRLFSSGCTECRCPGAGHGAPRRAQLVPDSPSHLKPTHPLGTAGTLSPGGGASVIRYLRKDKKICAAAVIEKRGNKKQTNTQNKQTKHGRNAPEDSKTREEGGGEGLTATPIPLHRSVGGRQKRQDRRRALEPGKKGDEGKVGLVLFCTFLSIPFCY